MDRGDVVDAAAVEQGLTWSGHGSQPEGELPVGQTVSEAPPEQGEAVPTLTGAGASSLTSEATPTPTPAPSLPPDVEERLRRAAELEQMLHQAQQVAAEVQRQQAVTKLTEHLRDRIVQAYQSAQSLPLEDGTSFLARQVESLAQELATSLQLLQQQQAQQVQELLRTVAAPAYAYHVAREHGLPADAVERLQQYAPEMMEMAAKMLKQEYEQRQALDQELHKLRQEIEQLRRGQIAQQLAAGGAHSGGGTNAVPITPRGDVEPGSLDHLLALLPPRYLG